MRVIKHGQAALELVPVFINGHGPYTFLLDTGSSTSSVTSKLATELKLPKTGSTARIDGVLQSKKVPLVKIAGWKVGHVVLTPEKVPVLNSSPAAGSVAGLLGSDELSRFAAVTENFQHHQLRLSSR